MLDEDLPEDDAKDQAPMALRLRRARRNSIPTPAAIETDGSGTATKAQS
jgi:hypothetical protein